MRRRIAPHKEVRERSEDVVLWRHERDLLCLVLCERLQRVHETRLDDFLLLAFSAAAVVRRGQAVLCRAGREGGEAGRAAEGGQESDVETRVEAAVRCVGWVCG